ncbi:rhomboid family intramembrane serine protease, partial [Thermodesulfobacteriota bacterium]
MIPLKDENPSKTIPIINVSLIIVNISVYIYQFFLIPGGAASLFLRLGCIPYEFTHFVDIDPPSQIPVPLTVFTSM